MRARQPIADPAAKLGKRLPGQVAHVNLVACLVPRRRDQVWRLEVLRQRFVIGCPWQRRSVGRVAADRLGKQGKLGRLDGPAVGSALRALGRLAAGEGAPRVNGCLGRPRQGGRTKAGGRDLGARLDRRVSAAAHLARVLAAAEPRRDSEQGLIAVSASSECVHCVSRTHIPDYGSAAVPGPRLANRHAGRRRARTAAPGQSCRRAPGLQ